MFEVNAPNEESEEVRWNNLESVVPTRVEEMDDRDLLQIALDQICDFQRQLQQESEAAGESLLDESETESDGEEEDDDDIGAADVPLCDVDDEVVVAGYEFCAQEALRFLVEEEQLVPTHPMVQQLSAHLMVQDREMDCNQVLANYLASSSAF